MASNTRPLIIGVTGGMASGKSTLARMFAGRGIAHVDADRLAHQLIEHDRETMAKIAAAFPSLVTNGSVARAMLAAHITQHPNALRTLEAILHPGVRALEEGAIAFAQRNRLRALVLDVPLLFETAANTLCDVVIVAHAPLGQRRARAFARPGMSEAKWQRLISRQWPEADKKQLADIVIATNIGKAATRKRVMQLMHEWGLA